jgi:hypothetical protein
MFMKNHAWNLPAILAMFLILNLPPLTAHAQGTAFTYQGQLQNNGVPASGTYNMQFSLYTTNTNGVAIAGPVSANGVLVANGLFTVTIDFGASPWNGQTNWLQVAVETNGAAAFTNLSPRQELTPVPYAIFANSASNLIGTLPAGQLSGMVGNSQLVNNSVTVSAGTGLSGGGTVALGGSTTLNNTGVTSLTGSQGVTVSAASGPVTLGSTATSANTAGAIVSRNALGSFSAGNITLAGSLFLPSPPVTIYSGTSPLLHSDSVSNTFVGVNSGASTTGPENTAIGYQALFFNTTGSSNVANGDFALYNNVSGSDNVADGFGALYSNNTSYNTAEGYQALYADVDGEFNVGVGYEALFSSTHGTHNTAVGYFALGDATNSFGNTAIGVEALPYVTAAGSGNTAVGVNACIDDDSGSGNTGIGYQALFFNETGSNNIALGYRAGNNVAGSSNIEIGNEGTGSDDDIIRIGTAQTATYLVGSVYANGGILYAGDVQLTGGAAYHNLSLSGGNALGYLYGSYPALGDGIHLGYNFYYDASGTGHVFNTGGGTSRISAQYGQINLAVGGVNAAPTTDRLIATTSGVTVYGTFNNLSDRNAKQDFAPVSSGEILDEVSRLPVSEWSYKEDPQTRHVGPVAQDFYSIFKIGTDDKHIAPIDEGGVALAAIQGLNQKVEELTAQNGQLQKQNDLLVERLDQLQAAVNRLSAQK